MDENSVHVLDSRQIFTLILLFNLVEPQTAVVKTGIVLTVESNLPYDYNILAPALEAAYERSLLEYNVKFEVINCLYPGGCNISQAVGQTFICANASVDFLIGPACTDDFMMSLELQTFFQLPSVTGAGDLVDSTAKFPYVTRCSYNTYTQWTFFIRLCQKFGWKNIAVLYDKREGSISLVNAQSLMKNLRASDVRAYDMPFFDSNITRGPEYAKPFLQIASKSVRIIVILIEGRYLRSFMLAAKRLGMTNGDYVFLGLDPFRDDILGNNGWSRGDPDDQEALQAYQALLVLTLRDATAQPLYAIFENNVKTVANRIFPERTLVFNSTFYDSVLLYALSINETLKEGHSIGKDNIDELSQKYWNRTFPGATGLVYINPDGDRAEDYTIYDMRKNGSFYVAAEFLAYKDFQSSNYLYDQVRPFEWNRPNNTPPPNEPICGYLGDSPVCDFTKQRVAITIGTTFAVTVVGLVVGIIVYNIVKRRAELAQLDLLGTWRELTNLQTPILKTLAAAKNNVLGSHMSLDVKAIHDNPQHIMAQTVNAQFRGMRVILRTCESDHISISRQVLAEIKTARSMSNDNILRLKGLCTGPGGVAVMYDYCSKGSLEDLLASDVVPLDWLFRFSIIKDIVNGLHSIQNGQLFCHGRLTSRCIFITSHFVAKIADYGLPTFFARTMPYSPNSAFCASLLWTPPEFLQQPFNGGSQEGDIFSLAILLSEIIMRERPYQSYAMDPSVIIAKLQKRSSRDFRPKVDANLCPPEITVMLKQCWACNPLERPRLAQIKRVLKDSEKNNVEQGSILDTLIRRLENHTLELERTVEEKSQLFQMEKEKSEKLLYQILPRSVVDQLKCGEHVKPEHYESVTLLYSDIVSFTTLSSKSTPAQVVDLLNDLYTIFDRNITKFDAYKVETIGDCYVVASGVPARNAHKHAGEIGRLALALLAEIANFTIRHRPKEHLRLRLGAHSGPCVAGVVGLVMPRFCLFGETVTIAAKMEATSRPMYIHISKHCEKLLQTVGRFETELRNEPLKINDKLEIMTYWLIREIID